MDGVRVLSMQIENTILKLKKNVLLKKFINIFSNFDGHYKVFLLY